MNFRELKEKAETLNSLILEKRKSLEVERQIVALKIELNKYLNLFEVSEKAFKEAIAKHFDTFGRTARFSVETEPAKGYHDQNKFVTKNYIVSIFDKKDSSKLEKRYTWYSRTVPKDHRSSFKYDLAFDLFLSPLKTSLFAQTPNIREVYWSLVRENCKEKYKQTPEYAAHKKFSKDTDLSFVQNKTGGAGTAAANTIK